MIKIFHIPSSNFGDRIAPDIVHWLSREEPVLTIEGSRYITIGSILGSAHDGDIIWGTGAMSKTRPWSTPPKIQVCAVRGPLTRNLLLDLGIECPVIYGDPGILVPRVYGVTRNTECYLGIVPHYVDWSRIPELRQAYPDARIIKVSNEPLSVIKQIAGCDHILSSSLHGLITAEALGIPACWIKLSDNVAGDGFKFKDYYHGSGRCVQDALDWRVGFTAPPHYAPAPCYMLDEFMAACPFRRM